MQNITLRRTIIAFLGLFVLLKSIHWISTGAFTTIAVNRIITYRIILYIVPFIIAAVLAILTIVLCCRIIFSKSIDKPAVQHLVMIFLSISLVYWYTSKSIDKSQKTMEYTIDRYVKGDESWIGQRTYRSAYTDLFREQQVTLRQLDKPHKDKCEEEINRLRASLIKYSQLLNKSLPMWNETSTTVSEVIQQSYLKDQEYQWIHRDIFHQGFEQLKKLSIDMENQKIFDHYKLQKFVILKKRAESKFSGWMDNRMLILNILKTITIDGGWIVYLFLLFTLLLISLLSNKPRLVATNLCLISIIFIIAFIAFFNLNSIFREMYHFESHEYLPPNHNSVLNIFLIHNSSCFHDTVSEQLNEVAHALEIDQLRLNAKRMEVDIQGLGESNKLPSNIFNIMDEFNANYSTVFCSNLSVVLRRSDVINKSTIYVEDYKQLPEECRYKIESIATFIVNFYAESNKIISQLKDIQVTVQKLQRSLLQGRYLPMMADRMVCQAWHVFKQQTMNVNQAVIWYSTVVWTSSLLLCLVALYLLSQGNRTEQYMAVQTN